jgi:tetratricopeptide (TPR) repeat protein
VELAESPYFNLVTDAQSRQTLELSGRSREEHILPPIALDLCQRVGAKVMIGGSIVRAGSEYILDLDSVNCLTAASLEHIETEVGSQDEVLTSLGRMIPSLRKKLGESVSSIQKFDVPILQATTKSLPALKAYTTGDELRAQGKDEESIPFYMLAIDLDPDFAVAYARLAAIYGDTAESELSAEYMKKSFERREHISEPEKLYIAAHYYDDVTRDTDKAIGIYELWTEIYPQDWIAFNNLATDYNKIGQPDKMLEAASRALALNAHHGLPYATLVQSYRVSSRFAEAKAVAAKAIAAKLDGYIVHFNLYMMAFAAADEPQMRTQIDWYHGKPLECWNLNHQALAAMSLGEVKKARALFELSRASALQHGMKEYAAATAIDEAQLESALGNSSQAKDKAGLALQISPDSTEAQAGGALALAQSGDLNGAIALADAAARRSPQNLLLKKVNLAAVKAADDLNGNRPSAALEDLADALPYDFSSTGVVPEFITPYDRGQSYLRLGSGDKAAVEFQKIISHRGINPLSLYLTFAHLGLARAYTLTGDTGKSLAQYREFFGIWKDADPDVSVLAQAKAEYAREQSLHDGA